MNSQNGAPHDREFRRTVSCSLLTDRGCVVMGLSTIDSLVRCRHLVGILAGIDLASVC
ncbi:MAG: hypothetical protein ACI93T_003107, partial [Porticoccaceae bacterium]